MSDELDPRWLEQDNNSNDSWDRMDADDISCGHFCDQICQIRGTRTGGLPGQLNGLYGIILGYHPEHRGGSFLVDMPQVSDVLLLSPNFVLVQTTASQQGALMLPDKRFLKPKS